MPDDAIAKAKALTKKVRKTLMQQQTEVEPADPAALAEMQVKNLDKFAKKLKKQVGSLVCCKFHTISFYVTTPHSTLHTPHSTLNTPNSTLTLTSTPPETQYQDAKDQNIDAEKEIKVSNAFTPTSSFPTRTLDSSNQPFACYTSPPPSPVNNSSSTRNWHICTGRIRP